MAALLLQNIEALFQRQGEERGAVDLLVRDGLVSAIGPRLSAPPGARVVDCSGKVALPGLVNTHHHFFQIMTRCLPGAQNAKLFDWLTYHYPIWRHVRAETVDAAARLAMAELLLTGCTTTSDHHYLFPPGLDDDPISIEVRAARDLGLRFCGTRGAMTLGESGGGLPPDDLAEDDDRVLAHCEEVIGRLHDPSPLSMCQVHLAPCSPFNVTPRLMTESAKLARRHHVRLHTHLAETKDETEYCLAKFGHRPLEYMQELEWLGPDVWYAHGVHFTDSELDLLAQTGTGVAHCPASNMRLGSGAARVPDMLARGVPVGLAVDGSASNDSSDMLGELRLALLLGRAVYGNSALTARQVISLATEGSARLLGRDKLGVLKEGFAADVALFDIEQLGYAGAADPFAALLLCGYNHTAWMVIAGGRIVVEDGHLTGGDEEQIRVTAVSEARKLWSRAGL